MITDMLVEETGKLNDLLEEAFAVRPIYIGMPYDQVQLWQSKLVRYWIEQMREKIGGN